MGRFVNPGNEAFRVALNSEIYIDKTGLIEYTNNRHLSVTVVQGDLESRLQRICLRHITAVHVIQKNCSRGWKSAEKATLRNI